MSQTKTVILRLSPKAYTSLLRASARQGLDIEEVAERALDRAFNADGKPRPDTTNEERADRISKLSAPSVDDPRQRDEIDRLANIARAYQKGS